MSLISETLKQVASKLEGSSTFQACVITKATSSQGRSYAVELPPLGERLQQLFTRNTRQNTRPNTHQISDLLASSQLKLTQTVRFFEKVFGKERLQRAAREANLDLDAMRQRGFLFSRSDIATLYAHFAQVSTTDLQELLDEIHSEKNKVRFLKDTALQDLRARFSGKKSLLECTTEDIDALFSILLPFEHPDHLLLKTDSLLEPYSKFTLFSSQMHWFLAHSLQVLKHNKMTVSQWEVYFAKRISSPKTFTNLVVRHPQGYLYLTKTIEAPGISKLIFEPLGMSQRLATHVLYRGTRGSQPTDTFRQARDSIKEDFTQELGAKGAIDTFEQTKEAFKNKEDLCLIGFSLGGAHAQRDALLFTKNIKRLVCVNAPGIDTKSADILPKILANDTRKTPLEITYTSDQEDFVDAAGQCHLGAGCSRDMAHISIHGYTLQPPTTSLQTVFVKPAGRLFQHGVVSTIKSVITAALAHVRPTCAFSQHTSVTLCNTGDDEQFVQKYLRHDPQVVDPKWEQIRSSVAIDHEISFSDFVFSCNPYLHS